MNQVGVLLINLGTPSAPDKTSVKKYLTEFLTDPRVIDISWLKRQFLVRCLIIPLRLKQSLSSYQKIWTKDGSPLLNHSKKAAHLLQRKLGSNFHVELAMRYQTPSIKCAIQTLIKKNIDEIVILPLFPQYASATTGSIFEKVFEELSAYQRIPKLTFIDQFHVNPNFIQAFKTVSAPFDPKCYDHVLFSFHGLPERHLKKASITNYCQTPNCCETVCPDNRFCYAAQCYQTAHAIAKVCDIDCNHYSISFQSRLGKDPWIQPFTIDKIQQLAKKGARKLLIFCPAFVADCLETIFEISIEYEELFIQAGGEKIDLVPGLNADSSWITALEQMILDATCVRC